MSNSTQRLSYPSVRLFEGPGSSGRMSEPGGSRLLILEQRAHDVGRDGGHGTSIGPRVDCGGPFAQILEAQRAIVGVEEYGAWCREETPTLHGESGCDK